MTKQKKLYSTLLIDPPYEINQKGNYGAIKHYKLMPLDRIKSMPIKDLLSENGHVWLWVPTNLVEYGYEIIRAWGLTPRSLMCWVRPRMTLGVYLRSMTEHMILATKNRTPIKFRAQPNVLFAPLQDHSHKPEEQFAVIERCSPGPFLELFARRRQPGWDVWGDDPNIESDIEIPGYPVPNGPNSRKNKPKGGACA